MNFLYDAMDTLKATRHVKRKIHDAHREDLQRFRRIYGEQRDRDSNERSSLDLQWNYTAQGIAPKEEKPS